MFRSRFATHAVIILMLVSFISSAPARTQAQSQQGSNDVVMILPFENVSTSHPEYNWVGESFADSLAELLGVASDLVVVSSDERALAYQRVRLPLTALPSRATAIKLAREAHASMIVLGTYSVTPPQGQTPATLQGSARVIKVNEGRLMGETMPDGRWATREYDFGGALTTLQTMQGRLAYQVLYQRDRALPFSQMQFVQQATKVPTRAFEAYVKGLQTDESDDTRANYFKNALHFYAEANAGAIYPQAAFQLGLFYLKKHDWKQAAEYLSKLQKRDPHYAEATFYASLCYFRLNDLSHALAAIVPLTSDMPLTGIYNNAGALSVQAARDERRDAERTRLLEQAVTFLSRAADSAPDDTMVRFNYAYALFLASKYQDAVQQLQSVITTDPRDGAAYFLFSKALEKINRAEAAQAADDQARRFLPFYAKWQTEWQRSQTTPGVSLRLRDTFNRSDYIDLVRQTTVANAESNNSTQDLLVKARELYQAGRDDEALPELRRVLTIEPMNAEAYLLIGRIHQRRGDQEAAVSALKAALFWDSKLIDAHILLGRIYLERGDRAMALSHARSAIQIDPNNQEAIALQRQVETGSR
ncbi:MAG TPA: tetratricopeptide repeat protein [Pyrinomonadaceae bacterium]|nr:tetratricopeptide repeat protein [Pyrinomonadaceae bacterium]